MTDRERLIELMIEAKRTGPETGSFTEYLADYLLANGVIVPPCCIGNVVHTKSGSKRIVEKIEVGRVYNPERYFYIFTAYSNKTLSKGYLRFFDYEIGKTVFLTREEAEQALREIKPCPFCGEVPTIGYACGEYFISPTSKAIRICVCSSFAEMHSSEEQEIEAWNRRAENG